ncbi:MAG: hypothetical protein J6L76_06480 [Clostridia bacterium]|nr:hypothetical protein [Clostridia bacterium]
MARKKSNANYYTELLIYAAIVGLEAVLLSVFSVAQPLVGYTLILLTTCAAGIRTGKSGGLIVGLVGGIASFVCGFSGAVFAAPVIYKLLVTCAPKMLMGFLVGVLYGKMARRLNRVLSGVLCVLIGLILNACGVCVVLLLGSLLNDTMGNLDLLQTIKQIFYSFVRLGKSILYIVVP